MPGARRAVDVVCGVMSDLTAAQRLQAAWRRKMARRRAAARRRGEVGVEMPHTARAARAAAFDGSKAREREQAAAEAKRQAAAAKAAAGKGGLGAYGVLKSEAQKKDEAEAAVERAARTIMRVYLGFCRRRDARRAEERARRERYEAAARLQAAQRGRRIRSYVGYVGETREGRPHGRGRMVWPDLTWYAGQWARGLPHGEGERVAADGACCEGQWRAGKLEGRGVKHEADGSVHEGQWAAGVPHGEGTLTLPNGSERSGVWVHGSLEGERGCYELERSWDGCEWRSLYRGRFVGGQRCGAGYERTDGGEYDGAWLDGRRHGVGRFRARNGWVYRGGWREGVRHGKGVLTSPMGHRFIGVWENGELADGEMHGRWLGSYVGQFKATGEEDWPLVRHGRGVWEGRSGERYTGQWRDDYYEGKGVLKTEFAVYEVWNEELWNTPLCPPLVPKVRATPHVPSLCSTGGFRAL